MERDNTVIVEVDDYKNALAISRDLHTYGQTVAGAVEVMAQWCATMRERYVEVGKALAQTTD